MCGRQGKGRREDRKEDWKEDWNQNEGRKEGRKAGRTEARITLLSGLGHLAFRLVSVSFRCLVWPGSPGGFPTRGTRSR